MKISLERRKWLADRLRKVAAEEGSRSVTVFADEDEDEFEPVARGPVARGPVARGPVAPGRARQDAERQRENETVAR